jgi:nicotinate dehydrogenase subunit B
VLNDTAIPYRRANICTVVRRLATTPLRPSWIGSPGRMQNTFANEAFLDEPMALAGKDPLDVRLESIDGPRGAEVLARVAHLSGWRTGPRPDPRADLAVGLAYVHYELSRTYVAGVAQVEVTQSTGQVQVRRVFVAHDCGQIINPNGTRNQIEGNVIQTVSRVLKERVTFDRKRVTSLDWSTYPILTFPEVPDVVIDLIRSAGHGAARGRRALGRDRARRGRECDPRCRGDPRAVGALHARESPGRTATSMRQADN